MERNQKMAKKVLKIIDRQEFNYGSYVSVLSSAFEALSCIRPKREAGECAICKPRM